MTPEDDVAIDPQETVKRAREYARDNPVTDEATELVLCLLALIDAQAARVRELEEKLMAASYRVAVHRPRRPDTKTGSAG